MIPIFIRLLASAPPPTSAQCAAVEELLCRRLHRTLPAAVRVEQVVVRATARGVDAVAYVSTGSSAATDRAAAAACARGLRELPELTDWRVDRCEPDSWFRRPAW